MTNSSKPYPIFDPENPTAFRTLGWRELEGLTKKQRAAYEAEVKKADTFQYEADKAKYTAPAPAENEYSSRVQKSRWITRLGVALREKGFEVVYGIRYQRHIDYPVHESWATMGTIYKDGQRVGSYQCWEPHYRHRPDGWEIETIRGTGSRPSSFSNTKRVKLLESAVNYVIKTAIPKVPLETEWKKVQEQSRYLWNVASSWKSRAFNTLNGKNAAAEFTMECAVREYLEDSPEAALQVIKAVAEKYTLELKEAEAAEADARKYDENYLEPMRIKIKKELPEVYS